MADTIQPNQTNQGGSSDPQPVKTRTGSGFVNLSQFFDANKNNQLGSTISNNISNAAESTSNQLGQAKQGFQQDLQNNTLDTSNNRNQASNIINQASNLGDGQSLGNNDLTSFKNLSSGQYAGPQGLNNSGQLQSQAQQVQQLGQSTTNSGGRLNLLKSLIGGNNYTQGEASLDNMLLGKDQGQLKQAQRQTQGIAQNVNNAVNLAGQQAQTTAAQNQAFGKQVLGQANQAYGSYGAGLNQRATDAFNAQDQQYQNYLAGLTNRDVTGVTGTPAMFTGLDGQSTYGVDPTKYLSETSQGNINAQNIANNSDVARLNALAQLSGTTNNIVNQVSANPYVAGLGDASSNNGIKFDLSGYNAARQAQEDQFNKTLGDTKLVQGFGFSNPYTTTTSLADALPDYQRQAVQAQQQLALGGNSSVFQPTIDRYNQALAQLTALQNQYGVNDRFKI